MIPAVRLNRTIAGMSAVLVPCRGDGSFDWPAFEAHVARTAAAGLTPAVNMDTGYVQLLSAADRRRALDVVAGTPRHNRSCVDRRHQVSPIYARTTKPRAVTPPELTAGMSADREIARIAKRKHGLLLQSEIGLSDRTAERWVAKGRLERPEPGVLKVAGAPTTWHQQLLAKCLTEDGFATMRASAALYRLETFAPHVMDVVVRRWKRRPNASVRNLHESTRLTDADVGEVDGIPCVSIEWTLLTLGAVVPPLRVEVALEDALRRGLTTPERLWELYLRIRGRGVRGIGVIKPMIIRRLGTHGRRPNGFEHRLRRIVRRAGLPELTPQWEIRDGDFVAFADWGWPDRRVALEAVSDEWHSGRIRRHRDTTRRNHILRLGILVVEFTDDHVRYEQDYVAEECWAAFRTGGRDLA